MLPLREGDSPRESHSNIIDDQVRIFYQMSYFLSNYECIHHENSARHSCGCGSQTDDAAPQLARSETQAGQGPARTAPITTAADL